MKKTFYIFIVLFIYSFALNNINGQCCKFKLNYIRKLVKGYNVLIFETEQGIEIAVFSEKKDIINDTNLVPLVVNDWYTLDLRKFDKEEVFNIDLNNDLDDKKCIILNDPVEGVYFGNALKFELNRAGSYTAFGNKFLALNIIDIYILKNYLSEQDGCP